MPTDSRLSSIFAKALAIRITKRRVAWFSKTVVAGYTFLDWVTIFIEFFLLFSFLLPFLWVFSVKRKIKLNVKTVRHAGVVQLIRLDVEMLGYPVEKMFAELQKMLFFKLLYLFWALDVECVAWCFYRKRIKQVEVPMNG